MLALAIEKSGLHKRIALRMILIAGSSGRNLIGGFMLVAALISMFVMNNLNYLDAITNWFGCLFSCFKNYSKFIKSRENNILIQL